MNAEEPLTPAAVKGDQTLASKSPRRGRTWLRILLWFAIFLSGAVVGVVGHAVVTKRAIDLVLKHPEQIPDRLVPMLRSRLSLSPVQAEKVERIVREHHRNMEAVRAETHPRLTAELTSLRQEVSAELDERQRERWNAWCDFVEARFVPAAPRVSSARSEAEE